MAHLALQRLKILPSVFLNLPMTERAFVIGSIQVEAEVNRKQVAKAEAKMEATRARR